LIQRLTKHVIGDPKDRRKPAQGNASGAKTPTESALKGRNNQAVLAAEDRGDEFGADVAGFSTMIEQSDSTVQAAVPLKRGALTGWPATRAVLMHRPA
jgi:hypothetical protein